MNKSNPVVGGILAAAVAFALVLAFDYVKALAGKTAFTPDWLTAVVIAAIAGLLTVFGPDAAQRKKNREALVGKFRKKS